MKISGSRSQQRKYMKWRMIVLFISLMSVFVTGLQAQPYQTAKDVPNPKETGTSYVSDPEGLLDAAQMDSLNQLLTSFDQKTGVEAAVVIINDFNADEDDFSFATQLFRQWGIGKKNADNGLLLFISTGRRQYRFITGYGVEGLLPDAALKTIGEHILVPAFKQQNYGAGIIAAFNVINKYLQQPASKKELSTLLAKPTPQDTNLPDTLIWLAGLTAVFLLAAVQTRRLKSKVPVTKYKISNLYADVSGWSALFVIVPVILIPILVFLFGDIKALFKSVAHSLPVFACLFITLYLFFTHLSVLSRMRKHYKDDFSFSEAVNHFYRRTWWHVLLSPLTLIFMLIELRRSKQLQNRLKPVNDENGNPLRRLNRDEILQASIYLSAGQLTEEEIGSQVYDIWVGKDSNSTKLIAQPGYNFDDFAICTACNFRTLGKPTQITLQGATYTHSGKAKRVQLCRNCKHEEFIEEVILPMLVRSTSSSSSGSGRSSSSSSSSSSGSWGGGSTGGGGAGGSW